MKIVTLCSQGVNACCPVVKLAEDHVEIGEEGNLCVLKMDEWETLKSKVLNKELQRVWFLNISNLSLGDTARA